MQTTLNVGRLWPRLPLEGLVLLRSPLEDLAIVDRDEEGIIGSVRREDLVVERDGGRASAEEVVDSLRRARAAELAGMADVVTLARPAGRDARPFHVAVIVMTARARALLPVNASQRKNGDPASSWV